MAVLLVESQSSGPMVFSDLLILQAISITSLHRFSTFKLRKNRKIKATSLYSSPYVGIYSGNSPN